MFLHTQRNFSTDKLQLSFTVRTGSRILKVLQECSTTTAIELFSRGGKEFYFKKMTAHGTFPMIKTEFQIPLAAANWKKRLLIQKRKRRAVFLQNTSLESLYETILQVLFVLTAGILAIPGWFDIQTKLIRWSNWCIMILPHIWLKMHWEPTRKLSSAEHWGLLTLSYTGQKP